MPEWLQIAQVFGVPVAILFATGMAIWRILVWAGPRVDKVIDRHIAFVDKVEKSTTEYQDRFDGLDSTLRKVMEQVSITSSSVKDLSESVRVMANTKAGHG